MRHPPGSTGWDAPDGLGADEAAYDGFARALLASAQADSAPPAALRRTASSLGVVLPAAVGAGALTAVASSSGVPLGLGSAAAAGGGSGLAPLSAGLSAGGLSASVGTMSGVALGAHPAASGVSLAFVAKYVGGGLLAGTLTAGGMHQVSALRAALHTPGSPAAQVAVAPRQAGHPLPRHARFGTHPASTSEMEEPEPPEPMPTEPLPTEPFVLPAVDREGSVPTGSETRDEMGLRTPSSSAVVVPSPSRARFLGLPGATLGVQGGSVSSLAPGETGASIAAFPPLPNGLAAAQGNSAKPQTSEQDALLECHGMDESRFIARARAALAQGKARMALAQLGAYSQRCAAGVLRGEAEAIRVEALLQEGRREAALQLAREHIDENPTRDSVERMRHLFATPKE